MMSDSEGSSDGEDHPPTPHDHMHFLPRMLGFITEAQTTYFLVRITAETQRGRSFAPRKPFVIKKRYSQFHTLRTAMKSVLANPPALPSKDLRFVMDPLQLFYKRNDPKVIKERAEGLSSFLWAVAHIPGLCNSKCLQEFLWSDVARKPTRGIVPMTPLSRVADGGGTAGDEGFRLSERENNASGATQSGSDGAAEPDGRWDLGQPTAEQLRRNFAQEGLIITEADMFNSSSQSNGSNRLSRGFGSEEALLGLDGDSRIEQGGMCTWLGQQVNFQPHHAGDRFSQSLPTTPPRLLTSASISEDAQKSPPRIRVVIMLVGSRGDVQGYLALGKGLQAAGHSVRVAAHECFRDWITKNHGLDFAPIAGDPKELLRMVVENNMFSYNFVKNGVTNHRSWVSQVLIDCWNACTQENPNEPTHHHKPHDAETGPGKAFLALKSKYRADLIIANPPSFAGWHVAEALGIPVLMTFPMPWTRTTEFPSPFTSLSAATSSANLNWLSYGAVDRLIWLGIGDLVNYFRTETLWLDPIWTLSAKGHRYIHDYRVPWIYCWSESVLKKPFDWGEHVFVSGYLFLHDSDGADWKPSEDLLRCFANPDHPVVFIGFGSIVVKDPERLSNCILQAAKMLITKGFNVLVQKGWAGVDFSNENCKDRLFLVGACPHTWIFPQCAVVVHHGGSGTTAEGLRVGVPTVIVPFFGDQFFWGETIKRRGLGMSEPYLSLTPEKLYEHVMYARESRVKQRCIEVAQKIQNENGVDNAIKFIETKVIGFMGELQEEEGWRQYPFYDLKKSIKVSRREHPQGIMKKLKYRGQTLLNNGTGVLRSTGSSLSLAKQPNHSSANTHSLFAGIEMRVVDKRYNDEEEDYKPAMFDFPFLPTMREGRVPDGHSDFSWFGTMPIASLNEEDGGKTNEYIPFGHTSFSWLQAKPY